MENSRRLYGDLRAGVELTFFSHIIAIIRKDLLAELRTIEISSAVIFFALIVLVIFNFAFELQVGSQEIQTLGPGVLWVAFAFSSMIGLGRSISAEKDKGSLEGLLLTPVDRGAIYLGKVASNFIFTSIMEAITLVAFVILFNPTSLSLAVIPYIILGTLGLSAIGVLLAAVAAGTLIREVMLPVLLFPVSIPLFSAGVNLTRNAFESRPFSDDAGSFGLLVAFDVIFLVVAFLLFEYVVEE
ncbi:MAG: heme exporter protein CcmB [Chloroflexi bacterium]|nr:heme exporter protein CcmB [Chloroflexota bacterium]